MTTISSSASSADADVYQAARSGAILVDRSELGYLLITGETRLDLLNRMSTQKVDRLRKGEGAATILTTDIGRIIDRLILYSDEDAVTCLTGAGNSENIARYLMRFVFFMDDFHIKDRSQQTTILAIYGPEAPQILGNFIDDPSSIPLHHWREVEIVGSSARLLRSDPIAGHGFFITCAVEDKASVQSALISSGAITSDQPTFEYLRVESGVPLLGSELTSDYIPLEAGLRDDISFNKGCYIGQEIIARMDSRGKLAKRLVRLTSESPIFAETEIRSGEKRAGTVTSAANGPAGPLALGYVKSSFLENETALSVNGVPITVIAAAG